MSTVQDLVESSMKKIGALAAGETASAEDTADCLAELNRMIATWRIESLMVYTFEMNTFSLVSAQANYTIGTGGDFNVDRPNQILCAKVRIPNQVDLDLQIWNQQQYADIVLKSTTAQFPFGMTIDGAYPLRTITVWPVPSASTASLLLWLPTKLSSFTSLSDSVSFPDGYEDAIVYNLAVRMAPDFGKTPRQDVVALAVDSKAWVKRQNTIPRLMTCDAAIPRGTLPYNFYVGPYT